MGPVTLQVFFMVLSSEFTLASGAELCAVVEALQ